MEMEWKSRNDSRLLGEFHYSTLALRKLRNALLLDVLLSKYEVDGMLIPVVNLASESDIKQS